MILFLKAIARKKKARVGIWPSSKMLLMDSHAVVECLGSSSGSAPSVQVPASMHPGRQQVMAQVVESLSFPVREPD